MRRRMMMEVLTGMNIGKNYPESNIANMFYALENGIAKTGIINYDAALPTGEKLVFSTDIDVIRGICIYDEDVSSPNEGNSPENTFIAIGFFDNGHYKYGMTRSSAKGVVLTGFLIRCSYRIENGSLYVSPTFGSNANYTPFCPGHNYRWIVW